MSQTILLALRVDLLCPVFFSEPQILIMTSFRNVMVIISDLKNAISNNVTLTFLVILGILDPPIKLEGPEVEMQRPNFTPSYSQARIMKNQKTNLHSHSVSNILSPFTP